MIDKKVELLAPAGDYEKLVIAVLYGADAVYIGGEEYSLRAKAKNFDMETMKKGIEFAHAHGLMVHMDGARISNAAAALGVSLDEVSGACGVDTLTLGGTKNGLMGAECVVVFNEALIKEARYARKQACQLASKMRYISCQFTAFLTNDYG